MSDDGKPAKDFSEIIRDARTFLNALAPKFSESGERITEHSDREINQMRQFMNEYPNKNGGKPLRDALLDTIGRQEQRDKLKEQFKEFRQLDELAMGQIASQFPPSPPLSPTFDTTSENRWSSENIRNFSRPTSPASLSGSSDSKSNFGESLPQPPNQRESEPQSVSASTRIEDLMKEVLERVDNVHALTSETAQEAPIQSNDDIKNLADRNIPITPRLTSFEATFRVPVGISRFIRGVNQKPRINPNTKTTEASPQNDLDKDTRQPLRTNSLSSLAKPTNWFNKQNRTATGELKRRSSAPAKLGDDDRRNGAPEDIHKPKEIKTQGEFIKATLDNQPVGDFNPTMDDIKALVKAYGKKNRPPSPDGKFQMQLEPDIQSAEFNKTHIANGIVLCERSSASGEDQTSTEQTRRNRDAVILELPAEPKARGKLKIVSAALRALLPISLKQGAPVKDLFIGNQQEQKQSRVASPPLSRPPSR